MIKFSSQQRAWGAAIAVALLAIGCGGRTIGDDTGSADPAAGGGTNPAIPVPTCAEICRHVVDACFPGGSATQCANDCEKMRTDFAGCKDLDPFLQCSSTARVKCTADEAIIDDCYDKRDNLVRCKS